MTRMFRDRIGSTVEVYIDDMIVKSWENQRHMEDLEKTFEILKQYKLRLSADKCAFRVKAGKFLGMIATLNRFVSKLVDRCRPFYQLLKMWKGFQWTEECDEAYQDLKKYLVSPPILSCLDLGDDLYMYLVVSEHAVSAVLLKNQDGVQRLIYYISKTLADVETQYLLLEKLALALGRIEKWGTRLRLFDIRYKPRNSVKWQVLANFVSEFTPTEKSSSGAYNVVNQPWRVFVVEASNARGAGISIVIMSPKGVEFEALENIRDVDVKKFVRKNIVTRFEVPESLVSDNRLQFHSKAFRKYYSDLRIKNRYSTLAYPQGNGQAEVRNKVIVNGLKKRLEGAKGRWTEKLHNILWAYRTTLRRSTSKTHYSMTYGTESVIPVEISMSNTRVLGFSSDSNNELMMEQLDLLEERREMATIRLADSQQKMAQRYDKNVRSREFGVGDLMLRKVVGSTKELNAGKLALNWEGSYRVTIIVGVEAYYLEDIEERPLP
nr:uncharacterized protein LOC111998971 [Quercus suber]